MRGLKDLLSSERGVFAILVVLLATLFVVLRVLTANEWVSLIKWLALGLIASKTIAENKVAQPV